tara:strand:- start:210 stop:392 length:183 start_codon:yes stop_codon:yes gene_type:complete
MVTEKQFNQFRKVQVLDKYNILDAKARALTDLTLDQWMIIIRNYSELHNKYGVYENDKTT